MKSLNAFAAAALLVCAGCSSPWGGATTAADPRPSFKSDPAARARLEATKAGMGQLHSCSPACLEALEALHARYSDDDEVVALLRGVYVQRKDWDTLIRLEEERPEARRAPEDRARLALWYHRVGRYRDASVLLDRLCAERPADPQLARLAGATLFSLGEYDRAVPRLEVALAHLSGSEGAEVAVMRGLIHFHKGELPAARQALERALGMDPEYPPAHGALGRVLAAQGETSRAREAAARSADLRARSDAKDATALRLSSLSQVASQAVQERRWDDGERIVQQMILLADPALKIQLYRYLSEVRAAAGRGAAAQEALRKADELSRPGAPR
jgi:tetratricopeptide (TPR) repeat protein